MPETLTIPLIGWVVELNWFTLMEAGVAVLVLVYLGAEIVRWVRR